MHSHDRCDVNVDFRLVAAVQVSKTNDCCYRKQSLHQVFREGQLYPLKLPVESGHRQVTVLAGADLMLSTQAVIQVRAQTSKMIFLRTTLAKLILG